jgi:hypothetical protein
MKVIFLDIDGVLATHKQYGTARTKLYSRDNEASILRIPYMWDERCVVAFNRFLRTHDLRIVLSSDWRLHFNPEQINQIFIINGVAASPIGFTPRLAKENLSESLESIRVREIQLWLKSFPAETWCAVDDMDLSELGERFARTDERMGFGARDFADKITRALYPGIASAEHGLVG